MSIRKKFLEYILLKTNKVYLEDIRNRNDIHISIIQVNIVFYLLLTICINISGTSNKYNN